MEPHTYEIVPDNIAQTLIKRPVGESTEKW
jgi:hypothetical protein